MRGRAEPVPWQMAAIAFVAFFTGRAGVSLAQGQPVDWGTQIVASLLVAGAAFFLVRALRSRRE
ncbi:MAG: hypothetical protein ACO1SV_02060 [Fimbriimonas sp.]